MLFDETYNEIYNNGSGIYKEKGSKFIGYSFLVQNENQIKKIVKKIKETEKSANHYCYAYVLYPDKSVFKTNDDGEPSSTAGKPILTQIKTHDLTNILIIVIRFFGGKKLGIPGLIRAYKNAALAAIKNTKIITKKISEQYELNFEHTEMDIVMKFIKNFNFKIEKTDFREKCKLVFNLPKNNTDTLIRFIENNPSITMKYIKLL
tara:strand:+ start:564 stop:1178 length:615 start_codon:yes stop_codon:yes gene_type:complete